MSDEEWQERAACAGKDPEWWFSVVPEEQAEAKRICRGCPVRDDCIRTSFERQEEYGIWGAIEERDRRAAMRRAAGARPYSKPHVSRDRMVAEYVALRPKGFTIEAIADRLDSTNDAVRSAIKRAREAGDKRLEGIA